MKRRWKVIGGCFAALLLLLGGLWLERLALAEWLLRGALRNQLQADSFTIGEFNHERLVVLGLESPRLSARRLEARYSLTGLLDGRIDKAILEGALFRLPEPEASGGGPLAFPEFPKLPALPSLPDISVKDSRVLLPLAVGELTLRLSGSLENNADIHLSGTLESSLGEGDWSLDAALEDGQLAEARLEAESGGAKFFGGNLGPSRLEATLSRNDGLRATLALLDSRNQGEATFSLPKLSADAPGRLAIKLSVENGSPFLQAFPSEIQSNLNSLSVEGYSSLEIIPWGGPVSTDLAGWRQFLGQDGLSLAWTIGAQGGFPGDGALPWDGDIHIRLAGDLLDVIVETEAGGENRLFFSGQAHPLSAGTKALVTSHLKASGSIMSVLTDNFMDPDGRIEADVAGRLSLPLEALTSAALESPLDFLRLLEPDLSLEGEFAGLAGAAGQLAVSLKQDNERIAFSISEQSRVELAALPKMLSQQLLALTAEFPAAAPEAPFTVVGPLAFELSEDKGPGYRLSLSGRPRLMDAAGKEIGIEGAADAALDVSGVPLAAGADELSLAFSGLSDLPAGLRKLTFSGALSYAPSWLSLEGSLRAEGDMLSLHQPLRLDRDGEVLTVESTTPGELAANGPISVKDLRLGLGKSARIESFRLRHGPDGLVFLDLKAASGAMSLSGQGIPEMKTGDVTLRLAGDQGILESGLEIAALSLADYALHLDGVSLDLATELQTPLRLAEWEKPSQLKIASLTHPHLASPAAIDFRISPRPDGSARLKGQAALAGGTLKLPLEGNLSSAYDRLSLRLPEAQIVFDRAGLQPGGLSPILAVLQQASGTLALSAEGGWDGKQATAKGAVDFRGLDFLYQGMPVRGLEGKVAFIDVLAPATAGEQSLRIASFDPGLELRDLALLLTLEPGTAESGPLIRLREGVAETLLGPLRFSDGRYALNSGNGSMSLEFPRLDLAALSQLVDIEGFSATGTLAGRVPLAFTGGTLTIDQGRLDEQEEGRIRYANETTRQALAGGGESVELMLDALENFQYQDLGVGLDKPSDKELTFSITLEGKNPDVLDGYPFRLNFNLTTDPTSLLAALRQGSSLGKLFLERAGRKSLSPP